MGEELTRDELAAKLDEVARKNLAMQAFVIRALSPRPFPPEGSNLAGLLDLEEKFAATEKLNLTPSMAKLCRSSIVDAWKIGAERGYDTMLEQEVEKRRSSFRLVGSPA